MFNLASIFDEIGNRLRKGERYVDTDESRPVAVLRENERLEDLEKYQEAPSAVRRVVQHKDFLSFMQYLGDFKQPGTRVYLSDTGFVAIIDHPDEVGNAEWECHLSKFPLTYTPEAEMWLAHINSKGSIAVDQGGLALLFDRRHQDILEPSPTTMQEIALTLEAHPKVSWKSAMNLQNGSIQFLYEHQTEARAGEKGNIEIPETFSINLKLYEGGPSVKFDVKLRYRSKEGKISFHMEWVDFEDGKKETLNRMRDNIIEAAQVPCHLAEVTTNYPSAGSLLHTTITSCH